MKRAVIVLVALLMAGCAPVALAPTNPPTTAPSPTVAPSPTSNPVAVALTVGPRSFDIGYSDGTTQTVAFSASPETVTAALSTFAGEPIVETIPRGEGFCRPAYTQATWGDALTLAWDTPANLPAEQQATLSVFADVVAGVPVATGTVSVGDSAAGFERFPFWDTYHIRLPESGREYFLLDDGGTAAVNPNDVWGVMVRIEDGVVASFDSPAKFFSDC